MSTSQLAWPDAPTTTTSSRPAPSTLWRRWSWWTVVAVLLLTALHAFSLMYWPPPFIDEAWYASHALGVLRTGHAIGPLQQGVYASIGGSWTYFPIIGLLPHALALALFGVNLVAVRLVSLAFGLLLLVSVAIIARRLYGERAGLLAPLLLGLSTPFYLSAHLARPDVVVAAAGFGAIALYMTGGGTTSILRSVLAGLAIGLAFDLHPNAALFGPILVALYLTDHGLGTLRQRTFWGFLAGCAAALALYAALHIAPNPGTFFGMTSFAFGDTKTPPLASLDLFLKSVRDGSELILATTEARAPLLGVALFVIARRHQPADRRLLALLAVMLGLLFVIVPYKPLYYTILFSPVFDLLLAGLLAKLLDHNWRASLWSRAVAIGTASLLLVSLILNFVWVRHHFTHDYEATISQMRAVAPAGSTIMGNPAYWFGLQDYTFIGSEQIGLYRRLHPGVTVEEILALYRPDYLVLDWFTSKHATDTPEEITVASTQFYIPRAEFEAFLRKRTSSVAEITGETGLTIVVVRIDWNTDG